MLCGRPGILLDRGSQRSLLGKLTNSFFLVVRRFTPVSFEGGRSGNYRIVFVPVGNKVLCFSITLCLSLFARALRECVSECASDWWHAQQFDKQNYDKEFLFIINLIFYN